ncbi:RagB/SusD family nutrient uptake outer membrane protein [Chitinophaga sp.]|uniref:RagB/SusD family nutrient uptake outer membrane protein n=1 Tax=Chitinophaga sp. TaxID=1869181 RepID=UPI002F95A6AA
MNKILKQICLAALIIGGASACNKYLDVKPETRLPLTDAFSSEAGYMNQLNGVYLSMTTFDMYGGKMNMLIPEILAQRYFQGSNYDYRDLALYNYTESNTKGLMKGVWSDLYRQIANINLILDNIDTQKQLFSGYNYNLIKGEALALRTFLHFDALRLFGPVYGSNDSANMSIPYYSYQSLMARPYLKANDLMDSLQSDINKSLVLLAKDPVITYGPGGDTSHLFTSSRKTRFNYYAAKTLQARMLLYRRDKAGALAAAQEVIAIQPLRFPFTGTTDANVKADPSLLGDCVFQLENIKLPLVYNELFSYALQPASILAPRLDILNGIYTETSDVRIKTAIWSAPPDGSSSGKCFFKYVPIYWGDSQLNIMMPILRAAECYLIAAEAAPDKATGIQYLSTLRIARNTQAVLPSANLTTELTREYRREFYGEGQLFYYYKRMNTASIPDQTTTTTSATVKMSRTQYVVPLPDEEKIVHQP